MPIERFDDQGLGLEPGNLAAISSLKLFRAFRFGANVELILTDNRSFRSEPIWDHPEVDAVEFIVGSISAPGLFAAMSYKISKDHPLHTPGSRMDAAVGVGI